MTLIFGGDTIQKINYTKNQTTFDKKCNMVNSSRHSIFNKKSIDEINSLTGYTFHYLVDIKEGRKKETPRNHAKVFKNQKKNRTRT